MAAVTLLAGTFGIGDRPVALSPADRRVDWLGGFLFTAGFVLLFFSISQARAARNGWATDCKSAMPTRVG
jgi:hypothetical protein